jgi:hypothetical protein
LGDTHRSGKGQLGLDFDSSFKAAGYGTEARVKAVDALGLLSIFLRYCKTVTGGYALDDQYAVAVVDLAYNFNVEFVPLDLYLTRFQRAGKRARQSTAGRGHHVVKSGRIGREILGSNTIVLGYLGMHAKGDGLCFRGKVGKPLRAPEALDPYS